jgi:alginate O-acetyltransferase complex protein AlgI
MVFSSITFLFLFLPLTLALVHAIELPGRLGVWPRLFRQLANLFLLGASLLFYFWGESLLIWALLLTVGINYVCALVISGVGRRGTRPPLEVGGPRTRGQTAALWLAVLSSLALLGFFKYFGFGLANYNRLVAAVGLDALQWHTALSVALPLGISFYTFQALSYTIDVYRGHVQATRNPIDFACYVTLFPQLVAGPIVRYADVARELVSRAATAAEFASGTTRFTLGLGKKVLLANTLASTADRIFALPAEQLSCNLAWLGVIAYTLQIYYDFSGYSDMAIGMGRMLGFRFPENFRLPYAARSIQDFWRRWHISLSTWLRDYLYIPLGGSRGSTLRTYVNLWLVFLLCGLWHGAGWTFVAWGLYHGLFLVLERRGLARWLERLGAPFGHAYTLLVVMCGWVLFRSDSIPQAGAFLRAMFDLGGAWGHTSPVLDNDGKLALVLGAVLASPLVGWLGERWRAFIQERSPSGWAGELAFQTLRTAGTTALLALAAMWLAAGTYNPFIYFRF